MISNISNLKSELILVKFPIIFPIMYATLLYVFPNYENELIILTLLLLAESHFGATWPFFFNVTDKKYILDNKTFLIYIPFIIVAVSFLLFFFSRSVFYLLFFAANIIHVTRQSLGVCKLYTKSINEINFQEAYLYLFNFIFFLIGFFKFMLPIISKEISIILTITISICIILLIFYYIYRFTLDSNFLTFLTGILIFFPITFVSNPIHGIIMGVTMHYTQYLYLTLKVCNGKKEKKVFFLNKKFIISIFIYSFFMTFFSSMNKLNFTLPEFLILIPLTGQFLHFYIDSQLWQFSKPHIRKNVLTYILK